MRTMTLERPGAPLVAGQRPTPRPQAGQLLLRVKACGVCRTDLHVVDGELPNPKLPLVPGHEIVGVVESLGPGVTGFEVGQRVGVPWLGFTCGACRFCQAGRENLCDVARFTGYHLDGGYAEFAVADARYCLSIPLIYSDVEAAPLLCAGLIGYRALRMTGAAKRIGFYGFGAAAHILAQAAQHEGHDVFAFTRPGDLVAQSLAKRLGAAWAGDSSQRPPLLLDAAIIFAPVGNLVPAALEAVDKGGVVVCAGIHMSRIPGFDYRLLWGERSVRSVANLTRADGVEFLQLAGQHKLQLQTTPYPLAEANRALADLRDGQVSGAAVLVVG